MTQRDEQLHIPLTAGFADRVIDEALPPLMRAVRNARFAKDRGIVRKVPQPATRNDSPAFPDVGHSLVATPRGAVVGYSIPGNKQLLLDDATLPGLPQIVSPLSAGAPQNAYAPMQVVSHFGTGARARELSAGVQGTAILNGTNLWVLSIAANGTSGTTPSGAAGVPPVESLSSLTYQLSVSIFDRETGQAIVSGRMVTGLSDVDAFRIGLTLKLTLRDDTSQIQLWYQRAAAATIYTRALSYNASTHTISLAAETTVVTPLGSVADSPFDVASGGARGRGHAHTYLIRRDGTVATNLRVQVYDVATLSSVFTTPIVGAVSGAADPLHVAVDAARVYDGTNYYLRIAFAYRSTTGTGGETRVACYEYDGVSIGTFVALFPAVVCDTVALGSLGVVVGSFVDVNGLVRPAAYVVTQRDTTSATLGTSKRATVISTVSFATGVKKCETLLDWYVPIGRPGAYSHLLPTTALWYTGLTAQVDALIPVFPMVRSYSDTGTSHTVLDPAVTVFALSAETEIGASQTATPIARLGVFDSTSKPGGTLRLCSGYEEFFAVAYEREPRPNDPWSRVGTELVATVLESARPCSYANDRALSLIAGAQPAYFDGLETVELAPLYQPLLRGVTYAAGTSFTANDYQFCAVYTWVDAEGNTHRSAPSNVVTLTLSNALGARLYVTYPSGSTKNGYLQYPARIEIYANDPGGLVKRFVTDQPQIGALGVAQFDVAGPAPATNASLYSDSGELLPICPGALWDITMVGERAWAILGERRSVALPSKLKVDGIAYEFAAEIEVQFPASAGKLQKVVDVDGNAVFLAENGVYVVPGTGPDNAGQGVAYSDPRKIADIGCTSRDSVVRTSAGVLYASRGCFAMLVAGGGAQRLTQVDPLSLGTIVGAVHVPSAAEAWIFGRGGTYDQLIFNYETGAWSVATNLSEARSVALAGDLLVASHGTGLSALDTDSTAPASVGVYVETGWIQPAGPQGACTIRELLIQGSLDGDTPHALTVTCYFDYAADAAHTFAKTFTGAEIEAAADVTGRYTLRLVLSAQNARAIKFSLAEGEYSPGVWGAFQPLSATLVYSPSGSIQRKFLPGASR